MIRVSYKEGFFDREAVIKALGRATSAVFNEFGRLVRKTAQKSLVYGDKPAPPGSPPTAHKSRTRARVSKSTGKVRTQAVSFLREFITYKYDKTTRSVVIGPERLGSTVDPAALRALEYGGTSTIQANGKRKRASIAAHPFMRPAAASQIPALPPMWRDSVRS